MILNRKLLLNGFIFFCCAVFGLLLYTNLKALSGNEVFAVLVFSGIAALMETRAIVLPSGEDLSLISPLLFIAGVLFGQPIVLLISVVLFTVLIADNPKKLAVTVFNCIQYGLSAYTGCAAYQSFGGTTGHLVLNNVASYTAFALVYFITNVLLVSSYLVIRGQRAYWATIKSFLDRKSLVVYFTMVAMGILMTKVIEDGGVYGIVIFSVVLWGVGSSYRSYYQMYDHFRHLSVCDELTGLYNHRYFQEKLQELIQQGETLSLLLLDLDYFKTYNDLYGHPQGDKLLKEVSELITECIPDNAICCRYGGEEFAVILPQVVSGEAMKAAEIIREAVANYQFPGKENMPEQVITVSIGVSTYPLMAHNKENLIRLADEALYKVKYTSRNKVQLYTSVIDELNSSDRFGAQEVQILQMIKTFLTIINSKDRYTYGHTERNMLYAEALARKIGLSEDEVRIIKYGALLHDVGKVEVPTEILNKKTRLTEEENQIIRMHVKWGERIVQPIKELTECLPLVKHHHERYDGKGYPDGLSGQKIPIGVKILTIVDSFDAMTTNRPYQMAKTLTEAIRELRDCAGTQFDPELVEPFIEVIHEKRSELKRLGA